MNLSSISYPLTPHWIYARLLKAGFRPRQMPTRKSMKDYRLRFTIQMPNKHSGITTQKIRNVIKVEGLLHASEVRIRCKNQKWIGITITVDCSALKALGN